MSTGVQKAMYCQEFQIQLLKAMDTNQGTLIELINYLKITTKTHHNISLNEDYFVILQT